MIHTYAVCVCLHIEAEKGDDSGRQNMNFGDVEISAGDSFVLVEQCMYSQKPQDKDIGQHFSGYQV